MKKIWLAALLSLGFILPTFSVGCGEDTSSSSSASVNDFSESVSGNACASVHTDGNNDGACDDCQENVLVSLDFYSVNDLHGKFDDTSAQIGVDELSTYLKKAKNDNPYTFVLSAGDMWQGSPESNLTKGALMTEWMNEIDFVSMTLGNHEFDWGTDYISSNAQLAEFPFLGINVYERSTGKLASYCQPSVTVEKNGVKVGIIGAIGDCRSSISGEFNQDLDFKTGTALTKLVKAESEKLRAEGTDVVVYSMHEDWGEAYDESLSNGYVDVVFEGHSHQTYAKTDNYGVYHLQAGGDNGKGISHASFQLNLANGNKKVTSARTVTTNVYQSLTDDAVVDRLMDKYEAQIAPAYETLGENDKLRESREILQTCAQLYYQTGVEAWSEYDIFLGGGYMSARAPYKLYAGSLCYADVMNVLPFDNQLVLCSISGKNLKEKFLSERDKYYVYCGDNDKNSVQDNKTYYIVTDTYSSTYSWNNLTEIERYGVKTEHGEYTFARDLLAKYIRQGGWTKEIETSTIPEILAMGSQLDYNVATVEEYAVWGEIISIESPEKYGNMTIEDENGNRLYIYGTWDWAGENRYGYMAVKPQIGDRVLLVGTIKNYQNSAVTKIEMENGRIKEIE